MRWVRRCPAGTGPEEYRGFQFPSLGGQLSYALSASETVTTGFAGGQSTVATSNVSGEVAYLSKSERRPFSLVYAGGLLGSTTDNAPTTTFQNLSVSQVLNAKRWNFLLTDTVNYLPQSPVGGLSGIPGLGDLGVAPVSSVTGNGPGILTNYQRRVSNTAGGSVQRNLTGKTSLIGSGSYGLQRFLGAPITTSYPFQSFDTNQASATVGVSHRIDPRNTVVANYVYTLFTYKGQDLSFSTHGVNLEYIRQWTPRLTMDVSVGPQFTGSSHAVARSQNVAAAIGLSYLARRTQYAVTYTRGANNGSGVVPGALSDAVSATARRNLNRAWSLSTQVSYTRSSSLPELTAQAFTIDGVVAGGQVARAIGRSFSVFGSYTLERQTTHGLATSTEAFSGVTQVAGFGVTYSPRSHRLGQ